MAAFLPAGSVWDFLTARALRWRCSKSSLVVTDRSERPGPLVDVLPAAPATEPCHWTRCLAWILPSITEAGQALGLVTHPRFPRLTTFSGVREGRDLPLLGHSPHDRGTITLQLSPTAATYSQEEGRRTEVFDARTAADTWKGQPAKGDGTFWSNDNGESSRDRKGCHLGLGARVSNSSGT